MMCKQPSFLHVLDRKPEMERETGFEPATLALARQCSTTELFPHKNDKKAIITAQMYNKPMKCQPEIFWEKRQYFQIVDLFGLLKIY